MSSYIYSKNLGYKQLGYSTNFYKLNNILQ